LNVERELKPTQRRILECLKERPHTIDELSKKLRCSDVKIEWLVVDLPIRVHKRNGTVYYVIDDGQVGDSINDGIRQKTNKNSSQGGCQTVASGVYKEMPNLVNQNNSSEAELEQNKDVDKRFQNESSTLDNTVNQKEQFNQGFEGKEGKRVKVSKIVNRPLKKRLTSRGGREKKSSSNTQVQLKFYKEIGRLNPDDIRVLYLLNAGKTQSQIAHIRRVSPAAISKQIRKLKKLRLIEEVEENKNAKNKIYKVNPIIFEIVDKDVNQRSRGIDPRVEWGWFRIHGFQRRYSISTSLYEQLIGLQNELKRIHGFRKIGQRPNWKFIVFERGSFKFEIRPRSIGISAKGDGYWIPFKAYTYRGLKDKLRRDMDYALEELLKDIQKYTPIDPPKIKPDGWSHDVEIAFIDRDDVIREVYEKDGKIAIRGLGVIDTSTGEPELEFEGEGEQAGKKSQSFKDALISIGKFANGEIPEPLKAAIQESIMEVYSNISNPSQDVEKLKEMVLLLVKNNDRLIQDNNRLVQTIQRLIDQNKDNGETNREFEDDKSENSNSTEERDVMYI